jgi:hypothetical protein
VDGIRSDIDDGNLCHEIMKSYQTLILDMALG